MNGNRSSRTRSTPSARAPKCARKRRRRGCCATWSPPPRASANTDQQIGRTLYNLLVPIELEAFLAGSGETQIEVDKGTAGIPWELLDDASPAAGRARPWAIRSKLLRKFRTETFRTQVNDADTDAAVLVIGEPRMSAGLPAAAGALRGGARTSSTLLTSRSRARARVA